MVVDSRDSKNSQNDASAPPCPDVRRLAVLYRFRPKSSRQRKTHRWEKHEGLEPQLKRVADGRMQ